MNAIILAAGLGSRFKDITKKEHKSLLKIGDKPNLERTIEYLTDAKVEKIIIVVGYLKEKFDYLKEKYGDIIEFVYNDKYREYNNIYSFYLAEKYFGDSFIVEADVVLFENVFFKPEHSTYFTTTRQIESFEWNPITDDSGRIYKVEITDKKIPSIAGISYWTEKDAKVIKEHLKDYMNIEDLSNSKLYWDNIIADIYDEIYVTTYNIDNSLIYEMDNVENYEFINQKWKEIKEKGNDII